MKKKIGFDVDFANKVYSKKIENKKVSRSLSTRRN